MGVVHDIRVRAHQKSLRQKLRQRVAPAGRQSVNLKNAKQLGLLFDADHPDTRKTVLAYAEKLRKQGKQVRVLGYLKELQEGESLGFKSFTKKDLDWAYRPKGTDVQEFMAKETDLLLHLSLQPSMPMAYICALASAKLRVGPSSSDYTYAYDLMIDAPESAGLSVFIEQMEALLGKTNTTHEPA